MKATPDTEQLPEGIDVTAAYFAQASIAAQYSFEMLTNNKATSQEEIRNLQNQYANALTTNSALHNHLRTYQNLGPMPQQSFQRHQHQNQYIPTPT